MGTGMIRPGSRVQYVMRDKEHEHWEGMVTEIETRETMSGVNTQVWV